MASSEACSEAFKILISVEISMKGYDESIWKN